LAWPDLTLRSGNERRIYIGLWLREELREEGRRPEEGFFPPQEKLFIEVNEREEEEEPLLPKGRRIF